MQTMTNLQRKLARLSACQDARDWVAEKSLATAWDKCDRPAWLLWLAHKAKIDKKLIVKCACLCARTSLKYVKKGKVLPRIAIETTERWIDGGATRQECRDAADAAAYAADYAAYATACAAADAAAHAAYAAAYAAYAADYAAYAAACAAYAAAHAARTRADKKMCRLIRSVIPSQMILEALGGSL